MESIDRSPGRHAAFGQLSLEGEELGSNVLRFEAPLRPDTKSPLPDHSGVHRLLTDVREAADGSAGSFPEELSSIGEARAQPPCGRCSATQFGPFAPDCREPMKFIAAISRLAAASQNSFFSAGVASKQKSKRRKQPRRCQPCGLEDGLGMSRQRADHQGRRSRSEQKSYQCRGGMHVMSKMTGALRETRTSWRHGRGALRKTAAPLMKPAGSIWPKNSAATGE